MIRCKTIPVSQREEEPLRTISFALFVTTFVAGHGAAALSDCLRFEPAEVELSGTLVVREFPGPPNYESVAAGDRPERAFILTLTEPICVDADPRSEFNNESQAGISEVQIWWPHGDLAALVNKRVVVQGTLSTAVTGHHRTPVILEVRHARAG